MDFKDAAAPRPDQSQPDQSQPDQPTPARATRPRRARVWDDADLAPADERRLDRRRAAETIVQRARLLRPDERALIEAVFAEGRTYRDLAHLARTRPDALRRRVRRALRRADSDLFRFVADRRRAWPPDTRRVARLWILEGRTLREVSAELGMTYHSVRKHADAVRAFHAAALAAHGGSR